MNGPWAKMLAGLKIWIEWNLSGRQGKRGRKKWMLKNQDWCVISERLQKRWKASRREKKKLELIVARCLGGFLIKPSSHVAEFGLEIHDFFLRLPCPESLSFRLKAFIDLRTGKMWNCVMTEFWISLGFDGPDLRSNGLREWKMVKGIEGKHVIASFSRQNSPRISRFYHRWTYAFLPFSKHHPSIKWDFFTASKKSERHAIKSAQKSVGENIVRLGHEEVVN